MRIFFAILILLITSISMCVSPFQTTGSLIIGIKDHEGERTAETQQLPNIGNVSAIILTIKSVQVHFKGPDSDTEIEAEIHEDENETHVEVEINDTEQEFILDTVDRNQIFSEISEKTGLSLEEVQKITEIKHEDAEIEERNESQISGESNWITVFQGTKTLNLLEFTGNVSGILGETSLSPGKYEQIRLFIENATITVDSQIFPLIIPSNVLKLVEGFNIEPNETKILILDFDVSRSIKKEGNNFVLRPTIKIEDFETDKKGHNEIEDEIHEELEDID